MTIQTTFNAEITAGSLLLRESRALMQLLLQDADDNAWRRAIIVDNVLQKTSPTSAKRMSTLIRKRLEVMPKELWSLIADGTTEVAIQSLLAASIKHSHLLGDFMLQVLRRHYREFISQLSPREWDSYLVECGHSIRLLLTGATQDELQRAFEDYEKGTFIKTITTQFTRFTH